MGSVKCGVHEALARGGNMREVTGPESMNPLTRTLATLCFAASAATALAHQIPNITFEAQFSADEAYALRVNVDPRVILSDQPTALPPIEAAWYLDQSEEQRRATHQRAAEYLKKNFTLLFSGQMAVLPDFEFTALDAGSMEALTPTSTETHLLGVAKGRRPGQAENFELAFGREANVSLVLLNSREGRPERRPQVIFPGESSRPYPLKSGAPAGVPVMASAPVEAAPATVGNAASSTLGWLPWLACGGVGVLGVALLLGRMKKRRTD